MATEKNTGCSKVLGKGHERKERVEKQRSVKEEQKSLLRRLGVGLHTSAP